MRHRGLASAGVHCWRPGHALRGPSARDGGRSAVLPPAALPTPSPANAPALRPFARALAGPSLRRPRLRRPRRVPLVWPLGLRGGLRRAPGHRPPRIRPGVPGQRLLQLHAQQGARRAPILPPEAPRRRPFLACVLGAAPFPPPEDAPPPQPLAPPGPRRAPCPRRPSAPRPPGTSARSPRSPTAATASSQRTSPSRASPATPRSSSGTCLRASGRWW